MIAEGLLETQHLEKWIVGHPEVIDPDLKVVTTQFDRWISDRGASQERPDVLALSSSGELVVLELKRDTDRRIHLQAITYGALAAGFTKDSLAAAHAAWLGKRGHEVTPDQAMAALTDHVESDWDAELLTLPRLAIVAEAFPSLVLTTVQWLSAVAPDLSIECHEYHVFKDADGSLAVNFQRLFPVDNLEDRQLRPSAETSAAAVADKIVTNRRRTKSVRLLAEAGDVIPEGAQLELILQSRVKPDVVQAVESWMADESTRRQVTWTNDPIKPLRWGAAEDPAAQWTPSALRNEIFRQAGVEEAGFSAADAWAYEGETLARIALKLAQFASTE
ncbi:hypothetical protein ACF3NT_11335 [Naumannella halotolerans]|uniref:hypothetical protein n=1 Tax=Naumannella halotolerans TaxID=993414 RepID=UPI00370D3278